MATVPGSRQDDSGRAGIAGLTPAERHALLRSAPLTPAQFKAQREVAERRSVPLGMLLDGPRRRTPPRPGARA